MYVRREIHPSVIWFFSKRAVILFLAHSLLVYFAYTKLRLTCIALPFLPVATIATAVAFYVGFKNNASYERLWEGRKIWAEIEYLCRLWATLITSRNTLDEAFNDERQMLIYRQLAWVNSLRITLRSYHPFAGESVGNLKQVLLVARKVGRTDVNAEISEELARFLSVDEVALVLQTQNVPCNVLSEQLRAVCKLTGNGINDEAAAAKLYDLLKECFQQQSACERLNNIPFPRQYAHFSSLFVNIFIILLPFSLLSEVKNHVWLVIPFSLLISWVFFTMEKVGDSSENPFENGLNDVPLSSICRGIEIESRKALRERNLPTALEPCDFVLM